MTILSYVIVILVISGIIMAVKETEPERKDHRESYQGTQACIIQPKEHRTVVETCQRGPTSGGGLEQDLRRSQTTLHTIS
jgi:hypothetical protein